MKKIYFTLTGTSFRYGSDFLTSGMKLRLEKEPENTYDREAIRVVCPGMGTIGYVANSIHTVKGETMSAGRLYDKIGATARAKVVTVTPAGTICRVCKKSLLENIRQTPGSREEQWIPAWKPVGEDET